MASTSGYVAPLANPKLGTAYGVAGSMWASGHHTGADFVAATGTRCAPLRPAPWSRPATAAPTATRSRSSSPTASTPSTRTCPRSA
ncbi:hypothetical protein ACFQ0M_38445 [Kitasatospora aburaviensis]